MAKSFRAHDHLALQSHKESVAVIEKQLEELKANEPEPISLTQHPDGNSPKVLAPGIIVMPGDYYGQRDGKPVVVPAAEFEEGGAWSRA